MAERERERDRERERERERNKIIYIYTRDGNRKKNVSGPRPLTHTNN